LNFSSLEIHTRSRYPFDMTESPKRKKRPRDLSLLARSIVEDATGEKSPPKEPPKEEKEEEPKNPNAQALGRLGGAKGGKASAARLTPEERTERARKAAKAKWSRIRKK